MNNDFEARVKDLKSRAHGHWTSILRNLGVDEDILKGKNLPCPIDGCGGTDRFQYTDKFGEGNYHCSPTPFEVVDSAICSTTSRG